MSSPESTTRTVPILMYHSVAVTSNPRYRHLAVAPDLLREQLDFLVADGWSTLTVGQYAAARAAGEPLPAKVALLTFDDAFTDFHARALPLLAERGLAATLFVPTGAVGGTSRWMTLERETQRPILDWAALREIAAAGVECGAHSHTHAQLDRLPPWRLWAELRRPRELLAQQLQQEIQTFAYPYGYHSARVRAATAAAGYRAACAVSNVPAIASDDLFELPRLTVAGGSTASDLARLIRTPRREAAVQGARLKAVVWRAARRCGLETPVLRIAYR